MSNKFNVVKSVRLVGMAYKGHMGIAPIDSNNKPTNLLPENKEQLLYDIVCKNNAFYMSREALAVLDELNKSPRVKKHSNGLYMVEPPTGLLSPGEFLVRYKSISGYYITGNEDYLTESFDLDKFKNGVHIIENDVCPNFVLIIDELIRKSAEKPSIKPLPEDILKNN